MEGGKVVSIYVKMSSSVWFSRNAKSFNLQYGFVISDAINLPESVSLKSYVKHYNFCHSRIDWLSKSIHIFIHQTCPVPIPSGPWDIHDKVWSIAMPAERPLWLSRILIIPTRQEYQGAVCIVKSWLVPKRRGILRKHPRSLLMRRDGRHGWAQWLLEWSMTIWV